MIRHNLLDSNDDRKVLSLSSTATLWFRVCYYAQVTFSNRNEAAMRVRGERRRRRREEKKEWAVECGLQNSSIYLQGNQWSTASSTTFLPWHVVLQYIYSTVCMYIYINIYAVYLYRFRKKKRMKKKKEGKRMDESSTRVESSFPGNHGPVPSVINGSSL